MDSSFPANRLGALWLDAGGDPDALNDITLTGADPALPSIFRIGTAAAVTIGAASLAAAEFWRSRSGVRQSVTLDMRDAAIAFRSESYTRILGRKPGEFWEPASGYFRTSDDRWVQLHCQFPHLRDGVLEVLGCGNDRSEVAAAVAHWDGLALEQRCREERLCVALVRTPEEWLAHPQARALASLPLLEIIRIDNAPAEPLPTRPDRPLSGVKVLELTKVIAGPVCGRTLASHGAEVIRVGAGHLPALEPLVIDTGLGKRSAFVDLRDTTQCDTLRHMARGADVFVQGYRPGTIAGRGFGLDDLAALRPGIVYVTLSAYGHAGPWQDWRGFDSLTQSASGIVHEGMTAFGAYGPHPLPCQALDHGTGYLAAFGAMIALKRRVEEGGSWLVRVSLAQTGRWIQGLGRVDGIHAIMPAEADIGDLLEIHDSPWGEVRHVRCPARMSATTPYWESGPVPLGTHAAAWL